MSWITHFIFFSIANTALVSLVLFPILFSSSTYNENDSVEEMSEKMREDDEGLSKALTICLFVFVVFELAGLFLLTK